MKIYSSFANKLAASALLATTLFSCSETKEIINDLDPGYDVPTTYAFDNVDYSGQTARIQMLDSLERYIKSGNDGTTKLEESVMLSIYSNESGTLFNSSKDLESKTYDEATLTVNVKSEVYDYFKSAETASGNADNIYEGRLFDAEGHEPAQMVAKGLMGAVLYYQAVSYYLSDEKLDTDNEEVTEGKGTAMEHYWDEAFGYFGAAADYPVNTEATNWYWAKYAKSRAGVYDVSGEIFTAFLKGRAAITAKDYDTRDAQRDIIVAKWEELVAINVIHYLNAILTDTTDGDRMHHWSEALAFAWCLQYNASKAITNDNLDKVIAAHGNNVDELTTENIIEIKSILQSTYGFTSEVVNSL
ncbi:DUF4856 domain-containing protein [Flammeovirga aprica]|uniref:DUF4856 domain-containing protein n=1 Tax=Flammeovirga aprica JL-4 TaxID=694437 RepID=A0A7X9XCS8_9BACT|nr:DUF4856 domain-containing protein [Flammeovirga aprica]NME72043.1 DUF4856 domain-containing protein [Flammeovirga aprica JL-4]